jgi:hypothetical protein
MAIFKSNHLPVSTGETQLKRARLNNIAVGGLFLVGTFSGFDLLLCQAYGQCIFEKPATSKRGIHSHLLQRAFCMSEELERHYSIGCSLSQRAGSFFYALRIRT